MPRPGESSSASGGALLPGANSCLWALLGALWSSCSTAAARGCRILPLSCLARSSCCHLPKGAAGARAGCSGWCCLGSIPQGECGTARPQAALSPRDHQDASGCQSSFSAASPAARGWLLPAGHGAVQGWGRVLVFSELWHRCKRLEPSQSWSVPQAWVPGGGIRLHSVLQVVPTPMGSLGLALLPPGPQVVLSCRSSGHSQGSFQKHSGWHRRRWLQLCLAALIPWALQAAVLLPPGSLDPVLCTAAAHGRLRSCALPATAAPLQLPTGCG